MRRQQGSATIPTPVWSHYPLVGAEPQGRSWLTLLGNLGRSAATVDAYGRGLDQYLRYCQACGIDATTATLEHVSLFVRHLRGEAGDIPVTSRVSNATLQQRLTAVRLWYDHLLYQGLRERNPVPRGQYSSSRRHEPDHGGLQRGLVRRLVRMPYVPSEADWARLIAEVAQEGLRNRLMFALAYCGALRREELVGLQVTDFDVAHRLVRIRPETSKSSRARVVCYVASATPALAAYLGRRRALDPRPGPMFLSESDRNRRQPVSKWTWSKVVERLARQAGVENFSTHTLRHLRLTHLARAGWRLHEIATYAGHRNVHTTVQYIHLSGDDLLARMAATVAHLDSKLDSLVAVEP
jgi:integrase/recombinase XerD